MAQYRFWGARTGQEQKNASPLCLGIRQLGAMWRAVITLSGAQVAAYSNCLDDGSLPSVLETATWMKFFLGDQTLHMEVTFLLNYFLWTLSASPLSSELASGLGSSFRTEKDRLLFIFLAIFILGHRIRLNKHHHKTLSHVMGVTTSMRA